MKNYLTGLVLFSVATQSFAQQIPIGQWRDELTYRNAYSVTASDNHVYCATEIALYYLNTTDHSLYKLTRSNGLSDIQTSVVAYDQAHDLLLICYKNSNIDIFKDNLIINISDLKRKNIVGDKSIYSVFLLGSNAYLSCGFGIVVLDVEKYEIKDTYYIGPGGTPIQVNGVSADETFIYAATQSGVYRASLSDPFLADYSRWTLLGKADGLAPGFYSDVVNFNGTMYASKEDTLFVQSSGAWTPWFIRNGLDIKNLNTSSASLIACHIGSAGARITVFDAAGAVDSFNTGQPYEAVDAAGSIWIADLYNGLTQYSNGESSIIYPNGPWTTRVFDMAINSQSKSLYVAPGGWNPSYGFVFNSDGFFTRQEGWWNHIDIYNHPELTDSFDIVCVAIEPSTQRAYFGSMWNGIVEWDDALGITAQYDETNSSLSGTNGDIQRVKAADIEFDRFGNMWVSNIGALVPIVVRKPDGEWLDFLPDFSIDQNWVTNITFDEFDQTWIVIPRQGILVMNYGTDLDNKSDDQYKKLINTPGAGNLPSLEVNCLTTDMDGTIWVGTDAGVAVFYCPGDVFSQFGCDAQQIIVNSGGYNGYLLATENVKRIAVDGANRKWIATDNGVWLFSADGTELIEQFTFENSPLTSDFINALAIDQQSGEVYIGCENGIVIYRSDATQGSTSTCTPVVYPNPVRENYSGPIAISNVIENADIRITDASGTLIYKTQALGGQVIWDGNDYTGERAKTGVYLVWASNEDGSLTCMTKLLVVN